MSKQRARQSHDRHMISTYLPDFLLSLALEVVGCLLGGGAGGRLRPGSAGGGGLLLAGGGGFLAGGGGLLRVGGGGGPVQKMEKT